MIDVHTHIGQFYELNVSAKMISEFMQKMQVDYYLTSSTSITEGNYDKVLHELHEVVSLSDGKALPVLWITPQMLRDDKEYVFLNSELKWYCIKIHPQLDPNFWQVENEVMNYVISIAQDLKIPICIHTGEKNNCESLKFLNIINNHPTQYFILAHGRPTNEAITMMKKFKNIFVDTAFMSVDTILSFVNEELTDKILWGSDSCIIKHYYPRINISNIYFNKVETLKRLTDTETFNKISHQNAKNLFKLS